MRNIIILVLVIMLVCSSCNEKEDEPRYSGQIVLSTETQLSGQSYVFYGFSFSTGKVSTYSYPGSAVPDLALQAVELIDSVNIDMLCSNDEDAFYKNGIFPSPGDAETYFRNYNEVIATQFQAIAYGIRENQVWTVQTASKRFAKIWIKDIEVIMQGQTSYANVTIEYEYQPDGSRIFDCNCN
jgi:hypothetical protein